MVSLLLQHDQINVNLQRKDGDTLLFIASQLGHGKVVSLLLQHNQINVKLQRKNGCTPLYLASHQGHAKVVR